MQSVLDKFARSSTFRPSTPAELFALRVAQKLGDPQAARHYVDLGSGYSEAQILCAYRRARQGAGLRDQGRSFHQELQRIHSVCQDDETSRLMSIRIERRAVAAAIFRGTHLEYADSRQLSSSRDKGLESATGFVTWLLSRFPVESAALELIPSGYEFHRRVLHNSISQTLRERMLTIWEIPKIALLDGCGQPALDGRADLREIATAIWPIIAGTHAKVFIQDAAILGLHVQTERLFLA
jgi:hypothetical protein